MGDQNLTKAMAKFRRRARSFWDICIADLEEEGLEITEPFFAFRRLLFCAIVLGDWMESLDRAQDTTIRSTIGLREGEIRVFGTAKDRLGIQLNRTVGAPVGSSFDAAATEVDPRVTVIHLVDVFDWDERQGMDHEFYRVRISQSERHPELVGCYGLVRPLDCEFAFDSFKPTS